jgi:hypothetical protein
VWAGSKFVERFFDLDPSGLDKITECRFFLSGIDGVEILLADYLSD